jgi:PKD repeat protein
MKSLKKSLLTVGALASVVAGVAVFDAAGPAHAAAPPVATLPTDNPANWTPNVIDGQVQAIWQVGNRVYIGGTFTQVADTANNGGTVYNRSGLAAFDATTGVVDAAFAPVLSSSVEVITGAADGQSIYIGGDFNTVNGVNRRKVARLNAATGALITSFNASGINGIVRDFELVGNTLYIGGLFTSVAGQSRTYLASLNATTGGLTTQVNLALAGLHNGGVGKVIKLDVTPDGSRMLITGNFLTVAGQARDQVALIDLSTNPATVSPWHTNFYNSVCSTSFDSFTRDLDISEDGTFAVITTTGAYRANTSCDTIARLELTTEQANLTPTWISYTGGDTSYAVEIHDGVAYIGGHMRWFNNPFAADRHGAGGVSREGMGALDVITGLPYSWNPGRDRGIGLYDYHVTEQGIWAGSDTDRWNFELHQKLAFFPWAGGSQVPASEIGELPNDIFQLGRSSGTTGTVDPTVLFRINAGGPLLNSIDNGPNWQADTSSTSTLRNSGSVTSTAPDSLATPRNDATVPKGDFDRPPAALWTTERNDPAGGNEMQWNLNVAAGTPIQVRLYMANRATATNNAGERIFDVDLDGVNVIDDLDLTQQVGHDVGTMRAFDIVSDGQVNILFRHGTVSNPLINGIEIVRTDIAPGGTVGTVDDVIQRHYDGVTPPAASTTSAGTALWRTVRGAFMVNSTLYTLHTDGTMMRRGVDGSTLAPGVAVDMWSNSIMADIPTMTGIFYDPATHRIYYTMSGQGSLFYRSFLPESHVIGAVRSTATGNVAGLNPSRVRGMFLAQGQLWFGDNATGNLLKMPFTGGAPDGTVTVAENTVDWRSLALFRATNAQPNVPPTAAFTPDCSVNVCGFDGTGSTDGDGEIVSYSWTFGDGGTATGPTANHAYAAAGTYTVTLTVVDDRGGSDDHQIDVIVDDPPNIPPTAVLGAECALLTCSFDGSDSDDPDGTIESYAWDFGDGTTGSGATPDHEYAEPGVYHVTLTVTDDDDATGFAETDVEAIAPGAAALFRASASANSQSSTASLVVPAAVQPGDQLVYIITANSATTATTPAGWTLLGTAQDGSPDMTSWVFGRTADAGSAGSTVSSTLGVAAKSARTLVAYANAIPPTLVSSSTMTTTTTQLTTPSAPITYTGTGVISYWSDKSASNTGWTTPPSVTLRESSVGSGSGRITAAIADSNAPAGQWPGATATTTIAGAKGIGWTIVLPPFTGNLPPTAVLNSSCASLTCHFDASGSSDPDGTLTYLWDFGDGTSSTEPVVDHAYAADGQYNVVLTVTDDDGAPATQSVTVNVSTAVVGFRAANSNNQNSNISTVVVPPGVVAGDQMLLFVTANSATTATTPAGWTLLGTAQAGSPDVRSWVFTRTAAGNLSGTSVQTTLGTTVKSSTVLLAYSNAAAITGATSSVSAGSSTSLATPAATVTTNGSVVVSYWVDKTSGNEGWTLPGSVTLRANSVGTSSGRITAAAGDAAVLAGAWPGATATSTVAGSKQIGWTVVVPAP